MSTCHTMQAHKLEAMKEGGGVAFQKWNQPTTVLYFTNTHFAFSAPSLACSNNPARGRRSRRNAELFLLRSRLPVHELPIHVQDPVSLAAVTSFFRHRSLCVACHFAHSWMQCLPWGGRCCLWLWITPVTVPLSSPSQRRRARYARNTGHPRGGSRMPDASTAGERAACTETMPHYHQAC